MKHTSPQHHLHDMAQRLVVSLIVWGIILASSWIFSGTLLDLLKLLGTTIIFIYGGMPFYRGMYKEFRRRQPGMMTLVAVALVVAYFYSTAVFFGMKGTYFYTELITLIIIMLFGHWLEMRSVLGASQAVHALSSLLPATAHQILSKDTVQDIKSVDIKKGMKLLIKPGESVAADGEVIAGTSQVNEAALTGEASLQTKQAGDTVIAGSINGNGTLTIVVTKDQHDSYIAQVRTLVENVLKSKSSAQDNADVVAYVLTVSALVIATAAALIWFISTADLSFSLERFVTVMVTACPHALGLAVPLVIVVVTGRAAEQGILVRNRRAFETAHRVTTVVFDKTGTLTKGTFEVTDSVPFDNRSEDELLLLAASSERFGQHALGIAIKQKADELTLTVPQPSEGETIPGKGVRITLDGKRYFVGNKRLLDEHGIDTTQADASAKELMQQGKTLVYVGSDKELVGIIACSDTIRPSSYDTIKELKKRGIQAVMITGDTSANAQLVADKLGIDTVFAQALPHEKALAIEELQRAGEQVAMVGDGINDAPALATADIGIAIGAGTDVALETADVILVKSDPYQTINVLDLSRLSARKIRQNIFWATAYNVIALPLAAGLLIPYGIVLSPAVGALFMSLSTVVVALNARSI